MEEDFVGERLHGQQLWGRGLLDVENWEKRL
jgi:hypothetical protein